MRVIINFFVFGFIFYLIYIFFPDAFQTLVSWASAVYEFFHGLVQTVIEKTGGKPKSTEHAMALLRVIA